MATGASGIVFALWDLAADRRIVAGSLGLITAVLAFATAIVLLSSSVFV